MKGIKIRDRGASLTLVRNTKLSGNRVLIIGVEGDGLDLTCEVDAAEFGKVLCDEGYRPECDVDAMVTVEK